MTPHSPTSGAPGASVSTAPAILPLTRIWPRPSSAFACHPWRSILAVDQSGEAAQNLLRSLSGSTIEARSFHVEGAGLADRRTHHAAEMDERDLLAHALLPTLDQPERDRPVQRRAEIARRDETDRTPLAAIRRDRMRARRQRRAAVDGQPD